MLSNPIRISEFYNLCRAEIQESSFKFGKLTMEGDRWIACIDESTDGAKKLVIIDIQNDFEVTRMPNIADTAVMHPTEKIVALKKKQASDEDKELFQVFSLETKSKLKSVEVDGKAVLTKWLNSNKLGIVTTKSAYYLDLSNETEGAVKLIDRTGQLASENPCQIVGFAMDPQEKWTLLTGLSLAEEGKNIRGDLQLNSLDADKSQPLQGHCGCFGEAYIHGPDHKSILFAFVERKATESTGRIVLTEISAPPEGKFKFKAISEVTFWNDRAEDFPVYMQISSKFGVLYVLTKHGFYLIFEISTASLIDQGILSESHVFIGARHTDTDGVLAINRKGIVRLLSIDGDSLVPYITNQCGHFPNNKQRAVNLAANYHLPGAGKLREDEFLEAFSKEDYKAAACIVAECVELRTQETLAKFKNAPQRPGQPPAILTYFKTIFQGERGKLNVFESLEIAESVLKGGRFEMLKDWLENRKLECSLELAELVRPYNNELALRISEQCANSLKEMKAQIATEPEKTLFEEKASYIELIRSTCANNPADALVLAKQIYNKNNSQTLIREIAEIFLHYDMMQELATFLVETTRDDGHTAINLQSQGVNSEERKWEGEAVTFQENHHNIVGDSETNKKVPTCTICKVKSRTCLYLPCKHLVTCENCAGRFQACQICQIAITEVIKVDWGYI